MYVSSDIARSAFLRASISSRNSLCHELDQAGSLGDPIHGWPSSFDHGPVINPSDGGCVKGQSDNNVKPEQHGSLQVVGLAVLHCVRNNEY